MAFHDVAPIPEQRDLKRRLWLIYRKREASLIQSYPHSAKSPVRVHCSPVCFHLTLSIGYYHNLLMIMEFLSVLVWSILNAEP
jgi:hypothetical protein